MVDMLGADFSTVPIQYTVLRSTYTGNSTVLYFVFHGVTSVTTEYCQGLYKS